MKNIDRRRVVESINKTQKSLKWNHEGYQDFAHSIETIENNKLDWFQTLHTKLNEASLGKKYDCVICSMETKCIIESFMMFSNETEEPIILGDSTNDIFKVGEIAGQFNIYADAYLPAPIIILTNESDLDNPEADLECSVIRIENFDAVKI